MTTRFLCTLLVAVLAWTAPALAQGKRVALVMGNGAYTDTASLINTKNDAADLAQALRRLSFDVLDGIDLDKRAMERLIRQFEQKVSGADIALFFYAGHGVQVAGQNHLVPIDAKLSAEGDLDFETLPLSLVLRRMEREAKTSIVLLDACRDNPLARNLARSMGTRSTQIGQGLAEVKSAVGTLISFSTQPGNVALDGEGRNSPYSTALLREIESPQKDLMTVLAAVRGAVVQSTGGRQVPWEHTSLLGPVVLNGAPLAAAPPSPLAATAKPTANVAPRAAMSEAAEAWQAVKDTTSVAMLEAFVRRYGSTFHGDLAQARIAELKGIAKPAPPSASAPVAAAGSAPKVVSPDPALGSVSQALCQQALPFLLETGAFGSKPIQERAYADRVTYFQYGQLGRNDVARIARDYERRFPTRTYDIDQSTMKVRLVGGVNCVMSFEYNYDARNATEQRSGRGQSEFTLRRTGAAFEIVSETGRTLTKNAK